MASKKKKAAKAGAGAVATGKAAASNPYVQRIVNDEQLREDLKDAYESARKAYERMANGKGPAKALFDDKKTQRELKDAATSLKDAADALRGTKAKKKRRRGGLLTLLLVGGVAALVLSEDLRKKVLDMLFGAEEEFEYTSTTTPTSTGAGAGATAGAPAGST